MILFKSILYCCSGCLLKWLATAEYLRCGDGFILQPEPQLINDLLPKLRTKADRYSSAGTEADSSAKAD